MKERIPPRAQPQLPPKPSHWSPPRQCPDPGGLQNRTIHQPARRRQEAQRRRQRRHHGIMRGKKRKWRENRRHPRHPQLLRHQRSGKDDLPRDQQVRALADRRQVLESISQGGQNEAAQQEFRPPPHVHDFANEIGILRVEIGPNGPEFQPKAAHLNPIDLCARHHRNMPTLPQRQGQRQARMQVPQGANRSQNNPSGTTDHVAPVSDISRGPNSPPQPLSLFPRQNLLTPDRRETTFITRRTNGETSRSSPDSPLLHPESGCRLPGPGPAHRNRQPGPGRLQDRPRPPGGIPLPGRPVRAQHLGLQAPSFLLQKHQSLSWLRVRLPLLLRPLHPRIYGAPPARGLRAQDLRPPTPTSPSSAAPKSPAVCSRSSPPAGGCASAS